MSVGIKNESWLRGIASVVICEGYTWWLKHLILRYRFQTKSNTSLILYISISHINWIYLSPSSREIHWVSYGNIKRRRLEGAHNSLVGAKAQTDERPWMHNVFNEKFACRNLLRQELRNRVHANFSIHKMKFDKFRCSTDAIFLTLS